MARSLLQKKQHPKKSVVSGVVWYTNIENIALSVKRSENVVRLF
jgi:hypothetical protein